MVLYGPSYKLFLSSHIGIGIGDPLAIADQLRWEEMDAPMPERIEDINATFYESKRREEEYQRLVRESDERIEARRKELFASVGLRPDGRPTFQSMMEQARCFGLAEGIGLGLGEEPDEEEKRDRHNYWKYGVYRR